MQETGQAGKFPGQIEGCSAAWRQEPAQQPEGAAPADARQRAPLFIARRRSLPCPPSAASRSRPRRPSAFARPGSTTPATRCAACRPAPPARPAGTACATRAPGEMMLLGSYNLPGPRGIYWTPSPIFIHADRCERYDRRITSPRPCARGWCRCAPTTPRTCASTTSATSPTARRSTKRWSRAIGDERTAFVNIHTAKPGCLLCRVERTA